MKIDEEPVDEIKEALIAFFDRQKEPKREGYKVVAEQIDVNPQQLYYIISGRNAPTLKTVLRILRFYPDEVVLREAMSLPPAEITQPAAKQEAPEYTEDAIELVEKMQTVIDRLIKEKDDVVQEASELKIKVKVKEFQNENLTDQLKEHKNLSERWQLAYLKLTQPNLFADNDDGGIKIESSSQTTAWADIKRQQQEWEASQNPPRRMIGLTVKDDCKVLPMYPNAGTVYNQA